MLKDGVGIKAIQSLGFSTRVTYLQGILKHIRGPEHANFGKAYINVAKIRGTRTAHKILVGNLSENSQLEDWKWKENMNTEL